MIDTNLHIPTLTLTLADAGSRAGCWMLGRWWGGLFAAAGSSQTPCPSVLPTDAPTDATFWWAPDLPRAVCGLGP